MIEEGCMCQAVGFCDRLNLRVVKATDISRDKLTIGMLSRNCWASLCVQKYKKSRGAEWV